MKRATPFGPPIWTTVSTGAKSTPRSRLEVQTTAFRLSLRMACSTQRRVSLSILPWCMAISPASSGCFSSSFWNQISHCPRVLVNKRVVRLFAIMGITCSRRCNPRCPRQGKVSMVSGMILRTVIFLSSSARRSTELSRAWESGPSRTCRACSRFPMVAEIPQIRSPGHIDLSRERPSSI